MEAEKPKHLNDHCGWERYYSRLVSSGRRDDVLEDVSGSFHGRIDRLADELRSHGYSKIWIPGCGLSSLPRQLSNVGFKVVATDISPSAIEYQRQDARLHNLDFVCEVHDFRTAFRDDYFNAILNVHAFQGQEFEAKCQVAKSHYCSIGIGGAAFIDTINVQGQEREDIEKALNMAGFYIPYYEINREYWRELQQTNIPYVFVLGQPVAQTTSATKREQEQATLNAISDKYLELKRQEYHASQNSNERPRVRRATIIYSTG